MAKNMNYRCLHCGADLAWNPDAQTWKCEYCDSEFSLEELKAAGKGEIQEESILQGQVTEEETTTDGTTAANGSHLVEYTCDYCGAKVITDETTAATFCAYCQSPIVVSSQLVGNFKPEKVIPFTKTKEAVMMEYRSFVKKPLTPKLFYEKNHIEKLTGVYIPFFLYDTTGSGEREVHGTRVKVWQDRKNRYTKTDTYRCELEGSVDFKDVPVDASSKTDDAAMDSIEPFDFTKLADFSPAYLAGFMAERYDVGESETKDRMERRVTHSLKEKLLSKAPVYDSRSIIRENLHLNTKERRYVLLPVWILNTRYHGEDYLFAMNGQTGKFVGNLPIDKKKLLLYGLGTFAGSFALVWGIISLIVRGL